MIRCMKELPGLLSLITEKNLKNDDLMKYRDIMNKTKIKLIVCMPITIQIQHVHVQIQAKNGNKFCQSVGKKDKTQIRRWEKD